MWAMPTSDADHLRQRARDLRHLAALVRGRPLLDVLHAIADPDTWSGPAADRCAELVRRAQRRLDTAGDHLVRDAVLLERRADELDLVEVVRAAAGAAA